MSLETETIDRLFLELSQVTRATTGKELKLQKQVDDLRAALLPFAAVASRPGRLADGMTDNPLPDDAAVGLGVKVSAWKRAMELTGAE